MNRQAWRDFFVTVFFLGLAFIIALLSSAAAEQQNTRLAAIAAAVSLVLALMGALYIIPRLARNIRLEILRFAIRTSLTLEGLLFVVFLLIIAFAAWNNGNNLLYLVLSAMLAFLIAANLIARIALADVSIQLRFPDHIFAGEPANITVTLTNHKRLMPSYSLMVEALSEEGEEQERERGEEAGGGEQEDSQVTSRAGSALGKIAYFVLVPAGSNARRRTEHTFARRGRYPITGFRVATKFPAGFFKKWRRIDATGEILVYPKPQPLDDFYHTLPMLAGQIQSHARGLGDDLYSIRRYHPTDHIRNIDWKASAKSMQMMVREHMREDEWRLTIVFDTSPPPGWHKSDGTRASDEDFRERFEKAISMAASLANHFILERAEVELITTAEGQDVRSGSGYEHLYKILASLATLQPAQRTGEQPPEETERRPRFSFFRRSRTHAEPRPEKETNRAMRKLNGGIAWRLLDEVPVLGDDRRFKVLITSARKGTIPAHIWRSAHVVFMDDL